MVGLNTFRDRVAVVTGGASGIGRAVASALVAEGAEVAIIDIDPVETASVADEIGAQALAADVTDLESMAQTAARVVEIFGRVDLLVNNAGIARAGAFLDLDMEDLRKVLDVNLWGVIHGLRVFMPLIEQTSEDGFVVNTASLGGFRTAPGLSAYSMSKFAVVALTETLAKELAERGSRVGVGVLLPGRVATGLGRHAGHSNAPAPTSTGEPVLTPDAVAETLLPAILRGDFYIVTHPEALGTIEARHRSLEAAFHG
jgi:NAD(P)-dependent dehydrogenase (short-subunit alcohol dehydrogenase family)